MTSQNVTTGQQVRNPGPVQIPGSLTGMFVVFAVIGAAAFALTLQSDPSRAWSSFVINHFFFMSLAAVGGFFAGIHWLTGAMWSTPVRRIYESFTAYLPAALVGCALLYFGVHVLYPWADAQKVAHNPELAMKAGYLNVGFFFARNLIMIVVWILLLRQLVGNSVKQDTTKDEGFTFKNRVLSPIYILVYALTFTFVSWDTVMSLDEGWYSTIFGVYCFAGAFYAMHGLAGIMAVWLKRRGTLEGIVNENHLHDLGKYMFAFTIFWAYIGFAQFMLIWYANIPEETGYYIARMHQGWFYVSCFLLFGKFGAPFFLLMSRDSKRCENTLVGVGIFMVVAQWIDILWLVQPEFSPEGPKIGIPEIGVTLGFVGIFGLMITRFLGRNNAVPIGDPRLAQSVFHHHQ